jgi:hypothetical protein
LLIVRDPYLKLIIYKKKDNLKEELLISEITKYKPNNKNKKRNDSISKVKEVGVSKRWRNV